MRPQHTCPEESASQALRPLSICEDGSVGASDVFILVAIVAVAAALGWVVWNWTRRRFQ